MCVGPGQLDSQAVGWTEPLERRPFRRIKRQSIGFEACGRVGEVRRELAQDVELLRLVERQPVGDPLEERVALRWLRDQALAGPPATRRTLRANDSHSLASASSIRVPVRVSR